MQLAAACACMAPPRTLYLVFIHAEVIAVALIGPTPFLRLHGLLLMCLYAIVKWSGCRAPRILGPDLPLRLTNPHPYDGAPSSDRSLATSTHAWSPASMPRGCKGWSAM